MGWLKAPHLRVYRRNGINKGLGPGLVTLFWAPSLAFSLRSPSRCARSFWARFARLLAALEPEPQVRTHRRQTHRHNKPFRADTSYREFPEFTPLWGSLSPIRRYVRELVLLLQEPPSSQAKATYRQSGAIAPVLADSDPHF